ncbi:MAG: hypothetical protein ACFFAH_08645 [Promethearchaeota archaeon]
MPIGLIFMKWNELAGNEVLAKYPDDIEINNRTLMQVFNTHEYIGERGMISLMVGQTNIASYYTGPNSNYCILILLSLGEDPDDYEAGLAEISQMLLQNLEDENYLELIPSLFQRLSNYPIFNYEQQLINVYQNGIKRYIINRLRDEGVLSKSQLTSLLKFKHSKGYGDIDLTLFEFVQKDIIQILSVKNERSVVIFLIKDLVMFRVPPFKLIKNPSNNGLPKDLESIYKNDCKIFFQNYKISEEDNIKLIDILSNPQVYNIFNMLRDSFLKKTDFRKLENKGVHNIDNLIELLLDNQVIKVYHSGGNDYYGLISDFLIDLVIPEYILNVIKIYNDNKTKSIQILIKYLNLLKETYKTLESTK